MELLKLGILQSAETQKGISFYRTFTLLSTKKKGMRIPIQDDPAQVGSSAKTRHLAGNKEIIHTGNT
jgi:hypothetical protein